MSASKNVWEDGGFGETVPVHAGKSPSTRTGIEDAFGGLLPTKKRGIVSAFGNRRVGL